MKPLKPSLDTLRRRIRKWIDYCIDGVWNDRRNIWYVGLIKTANLSVRSYLDKNIQSRASALTYYTLLAVVPVLALILAIARGFGFQNLRNSLFALDVDKPSSQHRVDIQPRLGRQKGSRMASHPNRLHDHNNSAANPDDLFCRHLAHDVKLRSVGARQRL